MKITLWGIFELEITLERIFLDYEIMSADILKPENNFNGLFLKFSYLRVKVRQLIYIVKYDAYILKIPENSYLST